jgi:hypothetical protein
LGVDFWGGAGGSVVLGSLGLQAIKKKDNAAAITIENETVFFIFQK